MTTQARKLYTAQLLDNHPVAVNNIKAAALEMDNSSEQTAYIYRDGSALVNNSYGEWHVVTNYGLHPDHTKI